MRTSARRRACGLAGWVLVGMLAWVLAGCATRAPLPEPDPARVDAPLAPAGIAVDAEWLLPPAPAAGLVLLQHGFDRSCANLRGLAASLRQRGLVVLCLRADMAGGGRPALARALARAIALGLRAPDGTALPPAVIVAGHSAGAAFAARVGAALAALAPGRLAGALLLDPVTTPGFADALQAIAGRGRPVLALLAEPGRCSRHGDALPLLRGLPQPFIGLRIPGATHLDAEGEDTTALAVAACGQGRPQPGPVAALRRIAADWALDLAQGRPPRPEAGGLPLR